MSNFLAKTLGIVNWLLQFKLLKRLFKWMAKEKSNENIVVFFLHIIFLSLIFTALITPWIYILVYLSIPIFSKTNPLAPLVSLITLVKNQKIGFTNFLMTIFFMMVHYIFIFSCFYMVFGEIVDANNQLITGLWKNIYFSTVTFTTLGYGNLVPANTAAEVIASIEVIVGFFAFAFLIGIVSAVAMQGENNDSTSKKK